MPSYDVELSVVMPCLNEARTVGSCVRIARTALSQLETRGEIVVADNGSSDTSAQIAAREGALVVHSERRGYGCALRTGIAASHGHFIVIGDADGSYDFGAESLRPFLYELHHGADLVLGNRFRGGIEPGAMPWLHRYFGTPVMTLLIDLLFGCRIGDVNCGLRAFRKDTYLQLGLCSGGMEFASEMVAKAALQRQLIREVPTTLRPDGRDRRPHLRSFRDGWRHLRVWLALVPARLGGSLAVSPSLVASFARHSTSADAESPSGIGWDGAMGPHWRPEFGSVPRGKSTAPQRTLPTDSPVGTV